MFVSIIIFLILSIVSVIVYIIVKTIKPKSDNTLSLISIDSSKDINDIPLNRYPFLGAHDAATGFDTFSLDYFHRLNGDLPFVKTQRLNFIDMYNNGGARLFDLRVDIYSGETDIRFHHGIIKLQKLNEDESLKNMLLKAVTDKEIVILYMSHFDTSTKEAIAVNFNEYLSNNNILDNSYIIQNVQELNKSLNYYKNRNQYIITVFGDFLNDNFDPNIGCFVDAVVPYVKPCIENSCLKSDHYTWDNLFNYIKRIYEQYVNTKPEKMFMIQTFFQAAPTIAGKAAVIECLGLNDQSVKTEEAASTNRRMYEFFKQNPFVPNVIIVDNVNFYSKLLAEQLKMNCYKN
jgi:hypothetical protein